MKRIFLDIGAHIGQTAKVVLDPKYRFDSVYCFEPVPDCAAKIAALDDKRLRVVTAGLAEKDGKALIADAGGPGASIQTSKDGLTLEIELIEASSWFLQNLSTEDLVFVKINCEGSECEILDNLIDSKAIELAHSIMVDFDVRKIPELKHREKEIRNRVRSENIIQVCYCDDVMVGKTHEDRIDNWLEFAGCKDSASKEQLQKELAPKFTKYSRRKRLPKILYKIRRKYLLVKKKQ